MGKKVEIDDEELAEMLAEAKASGATEASDQMQEDLAVQETPPTKELTELWSQLAHTDKIVGTRKENLMVDSIGTTFYPKSFNVDEELCHALNRILEMKKSILSDWLGERDIEVEPKFDMWVKPKWTGRNNVFNENITDQMIKMRTDSLSRRSADGAFLKEINASRRYFEKKTPEDKIGNMVRR